MENASFVVTWVSPEVVPLSVLLLEAYLFLFFFKKKKLKNYLESKPVEM